MTTEMNPHPSSRLISLDVFRGLTIAAMILVNSQGSSERAYVQLCHARWNGWTMADLVFPFFLMAMGMAMQLSFAKRRERGDSPAAVVFHIIKRTTLLFALGLFLNGFPFFNFATLRIPGVLQRIAICYGLGSFIVFRWRTLGQCIWAIILTAVYWALLMLVPVPGHGSGSLEPAGNLVWWIDSHLMPGHTWEFAPAPGFDPEGLLSTLPAISTTLVGIILGRFIRVWDRRGVSLMSVMLAAIVMAGTGLLLDHWIPINKNLWTPSYVLLTGGGGMLLWCVLAYLLETRHVDARFFRPAAVFGKNAIAVYLFSELLVSALWSVVWVKEGGEIVTLHDWLFSLVAAGVSPEELASLAFSILVLLLTYLLAWGMDRRGIVIRL